MPFLYTSLRHVLLLCLGGLSLSCGAALGDPIPQGPDPIDHCLMACMSCYGEQDRAVMDSKQTENNNFLQQYLVRYFGFSVLGGDDPSQNEVEHHELKQEMERILLHCANVVCLTDLPRGAPLQLFWRLTCPALAPMFSGPVAQPNWRLMN